MMRAEKTIRIGGDGEAGRDVVVYEMNVEQLINSKTVLGFVLTGQPDEMVLTIVMRQDQPDIAALMPRISDLGEDIKKIGGATLMDVLAGWVEVNQGFFDRIRQMGEKIGKAADKAEKPAKAATP
jgi:hypothetical protein